MASIVRRKQCYWLSFYYEGQRYRTSLGQVRWTKAEAARNRVDGVLSLLKAGQAQLPPDTSVIDYVLGRQRARRDQVQENVVPDDSSPVTIAELLAEYRVFAQPPSRAPSSYATEMIHLEHFERFLGEKASLPLEEVGCRVFDGYKAHRAKTVRTDTVNKELQTLRQVFALGVRYRYVDHNPLDDVERFERAEPERRFLTGEEIEDVTRDNDGLTVEQLKELRRFRYLDTQEIGRLLELEATSRLYPALTIVAYTGIRRGKLLQLEWADVDLKRGKLWIKSRKGSRSIRYQVREIDIHPRVREALAEQREQQNGGRYVLADRESEPWKPSRADRALRRVVKGTEFEGIGFHTLRHSFSSNLARAGVDDRTIDYLMGHQTEAMRRRYQHLFPEVRRGAVERLQY